MLGPGIEIPWVPKAPGYEKVRVGNVWIPAKLSILSPSVLSFLPLLSLSDAPVPSSSCSLSSTCRFASFTSMEETVAKPAKSLKCPKMSYSAWVRKC